MGRGGLFALFAVGAGDGVAAGRVAACGVGGEGRGAGLGDGRGGVSEGGVGGGEEEGVEV